MVQIDVLEDLGGNAFVIACRYCEGTGREPKWMHQDGTIGEHSSWQHCSQCAGKGALRIKGDDVLIPCPQCGETGRVPLTSYVRDDDQYTPTSCSFCRGLGVVSVAGDVRRLESWERAGELASSDTLLPFGRDEDDNNDYNAGEYEADETERAPLRAGKLLVYVDASYRGRPILAEAQLPPLFTANTLHANVVRRKVDGETTFVATFDGLPAGTYTVFVIEDEKGATHYTEVSVFAGGVSEIDWREDD